MEEIVSPKINGVYGVPCHRLRQDNFLQHLIILFGACMFNVTVPGAPCPRDQPGG